jgi:diguanylate cyclase (GGDEF)-like protein
VAKKKEGMSSMDMRDNFFHSHDPLSHTATSMSTILYDWHIATDRIEWDGPIERLFGHLGHTLTGDAYHRRLLRSSNNRRLHHLHNHFRHNDGFSCAYGLTTANGQTITVEDKGVAQFDTNDHPIQLTGALNVVSGAAHKQEFVETYGGRLWPDDLFAEDFLSEAELHSLIKGKLQEVHKQEQSHIYLNICVDKCIGLTATHGYDFAQEILKIAGLKLKKSIRSTDMVGKVGEAGFGALLPKCNQEEMITVTKRLTKMIEADPIHFEGQIIPLTISIGGTVLTPKLLNIKDIIRKSEEALTEAQSMRAHGTMPKPFHLILA